MLNKRKFKPLSKTFYDSFPLFLIQVWKMMGHPYPTELQLDVARYIQEGQEKVKGTDKTVLNIVFAFRGLGKSQIAIAYAAWRLRREPNLQVFIISQSERFAINFTNSFINLIENKQYHYDFLRCLTAGPNDESSKMIYRVGPSTNKTEPTPSLTSKGMSSQIASARSALVIADDVSASSFDTVLQREALRRTFENLVPLLVSPSIIEIGNPEILVLGTPNSNNSIYYELRDKYKYNMRIWTIKYPNLNDNENIYKGCLAPIIQERITEENIGKTTEPLRFSDERIKDIEITMGSAYFQQQMMLNTKLIDADKYPLKIQNIQVLSYDPFAGEAPGTFKNTFRNDFLLRNHKGKIIDSVGLDGDLWYESMDIGEDRKYQYTIMALDPSGKNVGSDAFACVILSVIGSNIYIRHIYSNIDGLTPEMNNKLIQMCIDYEVNEIFVEDKDGSYTDLLNMIIRDHWTCGVHKTWPGGNMHKEDRIIKWIAPVLNSHKLAITRSIIGLDINNSKNMTLNTRSTGGAHDYSLFYQLTHIYNEKNALVHDDMVDCLAMGIHELQQFIGINQEEYLKVKR